MTSQMPARRPSRDGAVDRLDDTAPVVTYGAGSIRTEWSAFPEAVRRQAEEVDLGPVLTQVRDARATKRRQGDRSVYQVERGWRMARDGFLRVRATRPLRRRADGRYAPGGPWSVDIEVDRVDAAAGDRRVSTLTAPREVEADEGAPSRSGPRSDGEDGETAWRILPVQPRRTLATWVPFAKACWSDALTVLVPTRHEGYEQRVWYVRLSNVAVAAIAATRWAGMDGSRRDEPWKVDFYAAPLRPGGEAVARRDREAGASVARGRR